MWSWHEPPYVIIRDVSGYPYVFPGVYVIARDPVNSDLMYAGTDNTGLCCGFTAPKDGIYRTLDRGETWQYLSRVDPDQRITQIAIHPITPTLIFAGFMQYFPTNVGGVYRSTNEGQNWDSVLPHVWVHDFEIDPSNPNIMYVSGAPATGPWGIYRSVDTGQTWQRISDQALEDLAVHPITSTVLFGARWLSTDPGEGIYQSDNSGATWTQIANLEGQSRILVDQQNPSRMFAFGRSYGGIWKTENGGQSWSSATSNLPDVGYGLTVQSVAIDPTAANGSHAVACDGRFYTRELIHFHFLPLVSR